MIQVRDILGIALLVAFLLFAQNLAADPGVGWHLRTGEWILQHKQVPRFDLFLWGETPRSWIHDQWLSDLLFWQLYSVGGINLLKTVLLGMLIVSYVSLLGGEMKKFHSSALLIFFALVLFSPLISLQWFVRPLAFSFFFFQGLTAWLLRFPKKLPLSGALVVLGLFALWANLHAGFICGLLLLVTAALSELLQRDFRLAGRFGIYSLAAFCGTFINPYGLQLWQSALRLLGNPFFMQLNSEWQSPDFADPLFAPFWAILLFLLVSQLRGSKVLSLFEMLIILGFALLALSERRMIPYFGIVSVVPFYKVLCERTASMKGSRVLQNILNIPEGRFLYLLPGSVCFWMALLLSSGARAEDHLPALPEGIEEFAKSIEGGKVLHSPDLGGLLTFYRHPGLKAHIDDRNQVCPQSDYEEYLDLVLMRNSWREKLESYVGAILAPSDPLAKQIENEGWIKLSIGDAVDLSSETTRSVFYVNVH